LGEESQRSLLGLLEVSWQILQKSKMKLENERLFCYVVQPVVYSNDRKYDAHKLLCDVAFVVRPCFVTLESLTEFLKMPKAR
jgi:hypothetical protein